MHARRLPLSPAAQRRSSRRPGMRAFSAGVAQLAEHLFCKQVVGGSSPPASSILFGTRPGGLPERPKGAGCKPAGIAYVGSNPTPSTVFFVKVGATGGVERSFLAASSFRRSRRFVERLCFVGLAACAYAGRPWRTASQFRRPRRFVVRAGASVADVDLFFQDLRGRRGEASASRTTEVVGALAAVELAGPNGSRAAGRTGSGVGVTPGNTILRVQATSGGREAQASPDRRGSLGGTDRRQPMMRSEARQTGEAGASWRQVAWDASRRCWPHGQATKPLNASAVIAQLSNLKQNSRPSNAGVAQLVEHQPSKLNVEGSNPFSRSTSLATQRIGRPT